MYDPERFIKNNKYKIKSCCESEEVVDKVFSELREIKVALETQFLKKAVKVFKKYNLKTESIVFVVETYKIDDIDLYDEWMHRSDS